MRTIKSEETQTDPFPELSKILDPEAIKESSRKALGMSKNMILSESMPELEQIARDNGLTIKYDWLKIMDIYNRKNLNK